MRSLLSRNPVIRLGHSFGLLLLIALIPAFLVAPGEGRAAGGAAADGELAASAEGAWALRPPQAAPLQQGSVIWLPLMARQSDWRPTPTPTATASATPTPSATATPTQTPTPSITPTPSPTATPLSQSPLLRRFGLSVVYTANTGSYPMDRLPFGAYLDYGFRSAPPRPYGVQYAQMVPVNAGYYTVSWDALRAAILANPGELWIIGNEPECVHQGNRTPDEYATIYYRYYTFIKGVDPNARIAIGGVVEPTPLRLQWLDMLRQRYQSRYGTPLPVDVWNIHNMILKERRGGDGCEIPAGIDAEYGKLYNWWDSENVGIFRDQLVAFRQWMADRGERDKPLIITEYGILFPCFYWDSLGPPGCYARVNTFMSATFDYMLSATDPAIGYPGDENRLVQSWYWFSLDSPTYEQAPGQGFNGNLVDPYTGLITPFGEHWEQTLRRILGM